MIATSLVVTAGWAAIAPPVARIALAVAGMRGRPRLSARTGPSFPPAIRLSALVAGLALLSGAPGNVVVAAVLVVVGLSEQRWSVVVTAVAVAGVGALRVGSSVMDHLAGAHVVLGPAVRSPSTAVAAAAGLALAASVLGAASVLPGRPRGGWTGPYRSLRGFAEVLAPFGIVALGVVVAFGPPVAEGADRPVVFALTRVGITLGAVLVAALVRRVAARFEARGTSASGVLAAAASSAALLVAVVAT